MIRQTLTALALSTIALTAASGARADEASDRLLIVNGNSGRVIYDDGRNDLFCVTRTRVVGHTYYGRRIYRRSMACR